MDKLGKYEIIEKIGVGGFGVVYRGYDPFIKRNVAIKTCSAEDRETRDRFMREAEIAGNLQHRHIVTVFEFGFHGEVPYLVQEFLSGEDLDHRIRRGEALPVADKIHWLSDIARGLEYAHGRGVVHRDIKPANIRILDDGGAKILDFGIAKLAQQQSNLTQAGVTLGTASYLAPEQIRGEPVDVRTDIFSFGVLAYELLTYERPFRSQEISATFYKILNETPAAISIKAPGTPPELERIVLRCLEKDPSKRFSPTGELVRALERLDRKATASYRSGPQSVEDVRSEAFADDPEERTSAMRASMVATASSPIPIPQMPPVATAPSPARPAAMAQGTTVALGEMELHLSKGGTRGESYGMSGASASSRRRSRWPRLVGGSLAALIVVAAALVLAGPSIPGFEEKFAEVFGGATSSKVADDDSASASTAAPTTASKPAKAARPKPPAPMPEPVTTAAAPGGAAPDAAAAGDAAVPGVSTPQAAPIAPVVAPPAPEPPKPAILLIGPAWDPAMTVRIGGDRIRLDRERRLELEEGSFRLQFELEQPSYRFAKELRVKLSAGETERVAIPIEKPGRLTVQPHLSTRTGGSVRVDGEMLGIAPVRGRWLAPGEHLVEILTASGGSLVPVVTRNVTIQSDVELTLSFDVDGRLESTLREKPIAP